MLLLVVLAFLILMVVLTIIGLIVKGFQDRKDYAAKQEIQKIQREHPFDYEERCPHRAFEIGQTGVQGLIVLTTKWCKYCGKSLGPAKLKWSIFGRRWV